MNNNDVLRRIRYVFDFNDTAMIGLFRLGGKQVTRAELSEWLKKEDEMDFDLCNDKELSYFLNGFIIKNRGARGDEPPKPDQQLTNNMILMKLKIALSLTSEDVLDILRLANFRASKHELSALLRKPGHKHYRECLDQLLRNFLLGIQRKYRDKKTLPDTFDWDKRS